MRRMVLTVVVLIVAGTALGQKPTATKPAGDSKAKKAAKKDIKKPAAKTKPKPKYQPATPEQIADYHKHAQELAEKAKKFTPNLHLVETKHFLIYTAYPRSDDKPMASVCERMYRKMCIQFNIPPRENIWAGKCPLYLFATKEQFKKFTSEVDKSNLGKSAGYCHIEGNGFTYIVMGPVDDRTRFYEMLVHEATHGFLGRYIRYRKKIPPWLGEGLAEYMAATMVPKCSAAIHHRFSAKKVIRENIDISGIFKAPRSQDVDYGVAQSLVRYLIARDRKAFVKFVTLVKEGKKGSDALAESYHLTYEQLAQQWRRAVARSVR